MADNADDRRDKDRRTQPTPLLSRYTFFGRRKAIRREADRRRGGYVDRYSSFLFFLLILISGLNLLDAILTPMILEFRGWNEANPVVNSVMELYGDKFWIWKFAMVSVCLILLCLHSRFRMVRGIIITLSAIYLTVIVYQIYLLFHW